MQKRKDSRPIYTRVSPPSKESRSLPSISDRSPPPPIATSDGSLLSAITPNYLRSLPSKSDRPPPPAIAPLHLPSLRVPYDRVRSSPTLALWRPWAVSR